MNKVNQYLAISILGIGATISMPAVSGVEDLIDEGLSSLVSGSAGMSNVTDPDAGMTQRRGYISGGGASYRTRIVDAQIANFTAPSISGGCAGIDMFGGSFSMINVEQAKDLMKAIASNALSYSFSLALDGMCPTCMDLIKDLQGKIAAMNRMLSNSCEAAQNAVAASGLESAIEAGKKKVNWLYGASTDNAAASNTEQQLGKTTDGAAKGTSAEPIFNKVVYGNATWKALTGTSALGTSNMSPIDTAQTLMSIIGTVIVTPKTGEQAHKKGRDEPLENNARDTSVTVIKQPIVTLKDLISGSNVSSDGTVNKIKIYGCKDGYGAEECLDLEDKEIEFEGYATKIRTILIGSASQTGLVDKFSTNVGTITAEEEIFMRHAPSSLAMMIRGIAKHSPGTARMFAMEASEQMALGYAFSMVTEIFTSTGEALNEFPTDPKAQQMSEVLHDNYLRLQNEAALLQNEYGPISNLFAKYESIAKMQRVKPYFASKELK